MELIDFIKNLLYPSKCIFCGTTLADNNNISVCKTCYSEVHKKYINSHNTSYKYIDNCVSLLKYSGDIRDKIIKLKFRGKKFYYKIFASFMCDYIKLNITNIHFITYVPMHPLKEFKRGFNIPKLLAIYISNELNIELLDTINKKHTKVQSTLDNKDRYLNVENAYYIRPGIDITNKNILLIDDVLTTGATICACSKILKQSFANSVTAITIAK